MSGLFQTTFSPGFFCFLPLTAGICASGISGGAEEDARKVLLSTSAAVSIAVVPTHSMHIDIRLVYIFLVGWSWFRSFTFSSLSFHVDGRPNRVSRVQVGANWECVGGYRIMGGALRGRIAERQLREWTHCLWPTACSEGESLRSA